MDCYVYIRFSTPRQEQGDSKERQMTDCLAHADRMGWKVVGVIEDLGLSAWKGDHLGTGALGKFADRVRAGEIPAGTVLLCEKLDRLSRLAPRRTQRWMEDLTEIGLVIATVDGPRTYSDQNMRDNLMNVFEILMTAKLANDYSNNISDKVGKAWKRKIEGGANELITRKIPSWMTVPEGATTSAEIELIDDAVAKVVTIYQMAADGLGVRAIARKLNDGGVKSIGRNGTWDQSVVRHLLISPAVEGDYLSGSSNPNVVNKGVFIPGYYPRAVPADLVERARSKMGSRKLTGGREASKAVNLFSGLIHCEACGSRMYLRSLANGSRVYQCSNANQRRGCERNECFKHGPFEKASLDAILKVALDDRFFQRPESSLVLVNQIAEMKKAITVKENEAKNTASAIAKMGPEQFLLDSLTGIKADLATLESKVAELVKSLSKARGWASPSDHARRVVEIRDAIGDPDKAVRETARLKVMDALKGVVKEVLCDAADAYRGQPERTFTVIMIGGLRGIKFDNEGNQIGEFDLTDQLDDQVRMAATLGDPKAEEELNAYLKRKTA